MRKNILHTLYICAALSLPAELYAVPESSLPALEQVRTEDVRISVVNGRNIRVQNAHGATLEIYNITGVKVASFKIEGGDRTVSPDLPRGCYIVKVGKVARKVAIL